MSINFKDLNTDEKLKLIADNTFWSFGGVERLDIPPARTSDASNGIRYQYRDESYSSKPGSIPAICYPSLCACGCSFSEKAVFEMGAALGEECRSRHIAVLLGPGINIKRNPLCGRNFEYISEDPVLSGKLGAAFIRGIQSTGVAACLKHFALNNQETRRAVCDSVADEKTMWELYLRNFEIAVREGQPWVIMGAYNKLNGIYCCENKWLLNDVLRTQWGFDGVTVSDWGGVNNIIESLNAGLDVEMPGGVNGDFEYIKNCFERGMIKKEALDRAAEDIIRLSERTSIVNDRFIANKERSLNVARKMAEESFVLLKNEDGILPLNNETKILVVGELAKHPRYQGHGSGRVKLSYAETPWDCMKRYFNNISFEPGYTLNYEADEVLYKRALLKCESADVVLIFAGQDERKESEGFDRQDLKLPDEHNRLIKAISRRNKNTAVIVQGGAPVEMLWEDNVKAILMCYFSGSCFGSALLNVLSGKVSPSGKLAETFPKRLNDVPSYEIYPDHSRAVYEEGCEVGYRYYNKRGIETNYPFGYGLSYTKFEFSHLTACLTDGKIETKCLVRNTGECAGSAVVQIYIKKSDEDNAPVLAAFDKIHLEAGEEKEVVLEIEPKYIASYNGEGNAYIFEKGEYELYAAHSSVEPACRTVLRVDEAIEYKFKIDSHAPRAESEDENIGISLNTTLRDLEKYKAMKPVIAFTKFIGEKVGTSLVPNGMVGELVMDTPLRQLPMGTDGAISMATVKKAVNTINSFIKREKKKDGNIGGMR